MKKVSDIVFDFIENIGVKHVFMLPGGGCMHLVDSLGKNEKIKYICNLHEQASAIAAEAYGQYTNNIGVALVTTGPGSTNAITGVAGAWIDSTPLLVLSGQCKREDMMTGKKVRQMGIQEVDIISMVKNITKYSYSVTDPKMIKYHLQKAVYMACNGRKGPVWLELPLDVQGSFVEEKGLKEFNPLNCEKSTRNKDLKHLADSILKSLSESKRPVILAGNGIRLSNSIKSFLSLIDKLKIPVLTTWKAADFLEEKHPYFVGRPGIVAQRGANFAQQVSDCILILGARLDLCQTGFNHQNFAKNAKKIIVDIDENEINKLNMKFHLKIVEDVGKIIGRLNEKNTGNYTVNCDKWLALCKKWQKKYPVVLPEYKISKGLVNAYYLIDILSEISNKNDLFIPGSSGACAEITMQTIKLKKGQRILNTPGLGSMGFGLPASIGACLASNRKRTICIVGDGGLQHNIQELQTLKNLNLPIKVFILNNGGYGSIYNMQKNRFNGNLVACNASSGLHLPDICRVAKAYGLNTLRIKNQSNLKNKVLKVINTEGTIICDVLVDPEAPTSPRLSSEVLPDGTIISKPMEDLWPFLDRNEFNNNMLIGKM